jgi:hypothetical protein
MARAKQPASDQLFRCSETYIVMIDGADAVVRRGDIIEASDPAFRSEFCVPHLATAADERAHRVAHGLTHPAH